MQPSLARPSPLHAVSHQIHQLLDERLLGPMLAQHLSSGGKRLRAQLALSACAALGCPEEDAVRWAAACELLHNASLILDDLQDGDRLRRGQPALWVRAGRRQALNAGCLALFLPAESIGLIAAPEATRWRLSRALSAAAADMARGQAEELALVWSDCPRWDDYEQAALGKTAALFRLPVEGAALLAGAAPAVAARLARPFARAGLLFQILDDLLDLDERKERAPGADLAAGVVSAAVLSHLERHPADRGALLALLRAPRGCSDPAALAAWRARLADPQSTATLRDRADALVAEIRQDRALAACPALAPVAERLLQQVLAACAGDGR